MSLFLGNTIVCKSYEERLRKTGVPSHRETKKLPNESNESEAKKV